MIRLMTPAWAGSPRLIAIRTLLAVFLLIGAASVIFTTGVDLFWFRDVGYPDSASLLRIGDYARSGTIYPDPDQPPYLPSLYGPLFYVLLSLPYRLANNIETMRVLVRVGVLTFWISSLVLVFLIARRLSGSVKSGIYAALFALAPAVSAHWTTQIRSDLLGTTFSLLGIYFLSGPVSRRRVLLAASCSVLAMLCKQTFIAAPCAVLFYLLWRRDFSRALIWTGAVCLGTLLGYGLVIRTEPYALRELTTLSRPIYRFHSGLLFAVQGLWNAGPLIALGGMFAGRQKRREGELLLVLYCILAWVVALTSIMQVGGSTNYFLEPLAASAIIASLTLVHLENTLEQSSLKILVAATLAVILVFVPLLKADWDLIEDSRFRSTHFSAWRRDWQQFSNSVVNRALLSSYPDVTIYSRSPEVPDPLLNSVLASQGNWSWTPVLRRLDRSDYELLAMYPFFLRGSGIYRDFSYWNHDVFDAIQRNYQLAGLCAGMEIWTPRKPRPGSWRYLESEGCIPAARQ